MYGRTANRARFSPLQFLCQETSLRIKEIIIGLYVSRILLIKSVFSISIDLVCFFSTPLLAEAILFFILPALKIRPDTCNIPLLSL